MERPTNATVRIGAWRINPKSGQISRDGETARVEVRTMRLLLCLAEHAGEVVSIDDLLNQVWSDVTVAPDSVYIETVPRLGYRMVATVSPWVDDSIAPAGSARAADSEPSPPASTNALDVPGKSGARLRADYLWATGAALCLALVVAFLFYGRFATNKRSASLATAPQRQNSIAVLPFLDLTDDMNQEPFADGMTEELIDKLSKIPGLRVPPPTSSFYFKGKLWPRSHGAPQITIAEIAKSLGVVYVLDGSVRKSGARLRVDARLIRADNGYVVWSETYDRPFDDILLVQEDIAGEVAKALRASIEPAKLLREQ